jgi:hypothetical protein
MADKLGVLKAFSILVDVIKPSDVYSINSEGAYCRIGAKNTFFPERPMQAYLKPTGQIEIMAATDSIEFGPKSECKFDGIDKLQYGAYMMDQRDGRWNKLLDEEHQLINSVEKVKAAYNNVASIGKKIRNREGIARNYVSCLNETLEEAKQFRELIPQKAKVGSNAFVNVSLDIDGFKEPSKDEEYKPWVPDPKWYLKSTLSVSMPSDIDSLHHLVRGISDNLEYVRISTPKNYAEVVATVRTSGNPASKVHEYELCVNKLGVEKKNLDALINALLV